MTTKVEIINFLIETYGYETYLEIGVRNPDDNFNKIKIINKDAVDPAPRGKCENLHIMTSDKFFEHNNKMYDIIFIDGLHLDYQVLDDIENSLKYLNNWGTIVLHDCSPAKKEHQVEVYKGGTWNGTVWKAFAKLRMTREDLDMFVVNEDHGMGIVKRGHQNLFEPKVEKLEFEFLQKNRKKLLNLITFDEFKQYENSINS